MATTLGGSHTTIENQLYALEKVSKLNRWVPHDLFQNDRQRRLDHSLFLLSKSRNFSWLEHLVTGDEKWCFYFNHTGKRMWIAADEERKRTPEPEFHLRKVMLSIWWDIHGVIHHEFLPPNATITSEVYCNQLQRLKEKLIETRPQHDKVYFQQDNARPHSAKTTRDCLLTFGWEIIPHPPYFHDLAPTDYHLFRSLQNHLADRQFDDLQSLKTGIVQFLEAKPPSFYRDGIHSLPVRWQKVIDHDGDYFSN